MTTTSRGGRTDKRSVRPIAERTRDIHFALALLGRLAVRNQDQLSSASPLVFVGVVITTLVALLCLKLFEEIIIFEG